jgi:hypothetical protein
VQHPRFDLARFVEMFPLPRLREEAIAKAEARALAKGTSQDLASITARAARLSASGGRITSPFDLAVVESLRREVLGPDVPPESVPTDVFVFALGEPPAPHLTKIGGVPFRSGSKPWPTTKDGRPRCFVSQLSFVDSRDLYPDLPGDVLLVFVDPTDYFDGYALEWVTLEERNLVTAAQIPEIWIEASVNPFTGDKYPRHMLVPLQVCHGVVHRTFDLPPRDPRFSNIFQGWQVACLEGTKIGGVPAELQGPTTTKRFLGAIGSISPQPNCPFPWVNQPEPLTTKDIDSRTLWMLGDLGTLNLSFDERGQVRFDADCY